MRKPLSGSCQCGAIRFSFKGPLNDVWFCHCTQCRKNYGMYGAFVGALRKDVVIRKSQWLRAYRSSKNTVRTFCGRCGSPVTWDRKGFERLYVLAGLLDGKVKVSNARHIYVESKGGYYHLRDAWPKYRTTKK